MPESDSYRTGKDENYARAAAAGLYALKRNSAIKSGRFRYCLGDDKADSSPDYLHPGISSLR